MTTLVLLRHGESVWNAEGLFTGWVDVGLSEQGLAEAETGRRAAQRERPAARRRAHVRADQGHPDGERGA